MVVYDDGLYIDHNRTRIEGRGSPVSTSTCGEDPFIMKPSWRGRWRESVPTWSGDPRTRLRHVVGDLFTT